MQIRILILDEKYRNRAIDVTTSEQLANAYEVILRQRLKDGYWYFEKEATELKEYFEIQDLTTRKEKIKSFFHRRRGCEYEGF